MWRAAGKIVFLSVLVLAGSFGLYAYHQHFSAAQEIRRLEEKNRQLEQVVQRLGTEKRVAEVLVTNQKLVDGALQTTLLFVEYARNQTALPARSFTITGKMVHIDAMVIKFEQDFVKENDPLRGHSIALFTRIYGDRETPDQAARIDEPGKIPDIYRGADPRVGPFERELWDSFWRLADDAAFRTGKGVRVANGQGVWGPFEPGKLYTLTIESDGGINLRSEPVKPIYQEALKRQGPA